MKNYIYTYLEQHWICKIAYSLLHSWWQHFNKCEKKCYSRLEESLKELKRLPANVFFKKYAYAYKYVVAVCAYNLPISECKYLIFQVQRFIIAGYQLPENLNLSYH